MRRLNVVRKTESIRWGNGDVTTAGGGQILTRRVALVVGYLLLALAAPHCAASDAVVYDGSSADVSSADGSKGAGMGKHVVLLTGDEEYRSEEGLVQLAKILAFRHGFRATVLFAIDPKDGTINPNVNDSLPGAEALGSADAIVLGLRFRRYPDEVMKPFADAYLSGKPIVAVRTSSHAFKFPSNSQSKFSQYSFDSKEWQGGFGRQVLGETWVGHLGENHREATRGIPVADAKDHPLLNGVENIFAPSGAYQANPMSDSTILMRGQVLAGMTPESPLETGGKNEPLQPVAWSREHRNQAGNTNRVLCTTMGAATDLLDESLRRLLVNGVYWGLKLPVPQRADVRLVGDYQPSDYSFNGFRKGVRPADLTWNPAEVSIDE